MFKNKKFKWEKRENIQIENNRKGWFGEWMKLNWTITEFKFKTVRIKSDWSICELNWTLLKSNFEFYQLNIVKHEDKELQERTGALEQKLTRQIHEGIGKIWQGLEQSSKSCQN